MNQFQQNYDHKVRPNEPFESVQNLNFQSDTVTTMTAEQSLGVKKAIKKENLEDEGSIHVMNGQLVQREELQIRPIGQFLNIQKSNNYYVNERDIVEHEIKTEIEM